MIGLRFGKLVVMKENGQSSNGSINYLCKCDCGGFKTCNGGELRRGNVSTCGHCLENDMIGKRFGSLVVDKFSHRNKNGSAYFFCSCDCGNKMVTQIAGLKEGRVKSCGKCVENTIIGNRYGRLIVKEYIGITQKLRMFGCKCDCGNYVILDGYSITHGHVKSCGCLRSGIEQECINYFIDNNIKFKSNVMFDGLVGVGGGKLSYDFMIGDILIECQGKQHYEPIEHFGGNDKFKIQQEHDSLKKQWAKDNGYKLFEIRYDESPRERLDEIFVI